MCLNYLFYAYTISTVYVDKNRWNIFNVQRFRCRYVFFLLLFVWVWVPIWCSLLFQFYFCVLLQYLQTLVRFEYMLPHLCIAYISLLHDSITLNSVRWEIGVYYLIASSGGEREIAATVKTKVTDLKGARKVTETTLVERTGVIPNGYFVLVTDRLLNSSAELVLLVC